MQTENIIMAPSVCILNTQGEDIIQWFPKVHSCTVTKLKYFIEDHIFLPEANQVLYLNKKEIYDSPFRQFDLQTQMNDSQSPLEIQLAYKLSHASNIDEKAERSIAIYHIQKLPALPLKDAKYKIIVLEDVFEHIRYIHLVSTWVEKLK
uniref:Uncharacterized protein n=1 Tax=Clytia hemisphaerica TaxID=252671 RepID=A0A7M5WVH3_9CNID